MNLITDGLIWLSCSRETKNVKCLQTAGWTNRKTDKQKDRQTDRRRTTGDLKSLRELSV